jgi:diguanylate cyclase (GGDEF)-like protein
MLEPSTCTTPVAQCELLVVDDQQAQLKSLQKLLHISGYTNVALAAGGDEAIRILQNNTPQLILLDLQMPGTNGLDVITFHHQAGLESEIIVISGETSFPWVKEAMRLGAFDFICKPYRPDELLTTIVKAVDRIQEKKKLQQEQKSISYMAYHDQLTNLPNRQLFNDRAHQVLVQAQRNKRKFALLFMDMDRFKTINDSHGHLMGDRVLQLVATRILGCLRAEDTLSRYGGDEFALLLPDVTDQHGVTTVAEKILSEIRKPFLVNEHELHLSLSIGIAIYPSDGTDLDVLLHNADTAMYRIKKPRKDNFSFYYDAISHDHMKTETSLDD